MRFILEQSPDIKEVEITLRCGMMDDRLAALVRQIQLFSFSITAVKDGRSWQVPLEDIYYFESVDDATFLYRQSEVYECSHKLYELEKQLAGTTCVRVSKACILNTNHVESVRSLLGAKLEAQLQNGEKIIVNRHYVPAFKSALGIGEAN